ncbi:MAG: hemolysin family protein [bacterium]
MNMVLLVIIVMLLLSAFFSGMEIAFVSSSRLKQELDLKRKILPARILSVFYNYPSRFIGALLLGNNIALVVYGIAMAVLLEPAIVGILPAGWESEFTILLIQTIISTLLILITAEFLPKILFRINPNAILKFFSLPVWIFYFLFYPVIMIYIGISELLLKKVLRVNLADTGYQFGPVDLEDYVRDFQHAEEREENINKEIQMVQNVMSFRNVKLRDCMVPRTDIKAVELHDDISSLVKVFPETGHSKIMVYRDSIDNLIGYVHSYDMFSKPKSIEAVTRDINAYPESMAANELLNIFIRDHKSVAVVVDEFGGTSGIVTMEDIIEEIFGEIHDEYDREEVTETQVSSTEFIFSSRLEIDYLNEKYKLNIPVSDEYETLAGFIIQYHESIPVEDETIDIQPFRFTILKSSGNRIDEVKLELTE